MPEHPYKGQQWREVRHDNTVTWLAFWKDPISAKDYKYVWLAANSSFKSESDLAKYEKARKLKVRQQLPLLCCSASVIPPLNASIMDGGQHTPLVSSICCDQERDL